MQEMKGVRSEENSHKHTDLAILSKWNRGAKIHNEESCNTWNQKDSSDEDKARHNRNKNRENNITDSNLTRNLLCKNINEEKRR